MERLSKCCYGMNCITTKLEETQLIFIALSVFVTNLLIASLTGWFLIYDISNRIKNNYCMSQLLCCIGKHSLSIVILHFLSFKIVNYIGICINKEPHYLLAAFPVLYTDKLWWILYTMVGIGIPIVVTVLWEKLFFPLGWKMYMCFRGEKWTKSYKKE